MFEFGTNEGGNVSVLGSWMSMSADVNKRINRGNGLWWRVKGGLKSSRLTKRLQGRVVEACVESSLLGCWSFRPSDLFGPKIQGRFGHAGRFSPAGRFGPRFKSFGPFSTII